MRLSTLCLLFAGLGLAFIPATYAQPVSATLILAEGDDPDGTGTLVNNLDFPVVNGDGQVGFIGDFGTDADFIWYGAGITFRNSDALPTVLEGADGSLGIGASGEFAFNPDVDTFDAIWSNMGEVIREDDPAPGFAGQFISILSRATMTDNGTLYFLAGVTATVGGSTDFEVIYRKAPGGPIEVFYAEPDPVGGIATDGIDSDFNISNDDSHSIYFVNLDTGSATDDAAIVVDGVIVAQESVTSTGDGVGDFFDNFDQLDIGNDGTYVFTGDSDGATATDEYIAVGVAGGGPPVVLIREGSMLAGTTVSGPVDALDLTDNGFIGFLWEVGGVETAFVAELADLANARTVFQVGDELDFDGDAVGDFVIDDVNTTFIAQVGYGVAVSDDGFMYFNLDVTPVGGGTQVEAMVRFDVSDVIPVELVSFTGTANGDTAVLDWATASETNNAGFEVQMDRGVGFETMAFVNGHGTTTEAQTYRHTVAGLTPGSYTFRLKQIDFDGAFEYSGEVEVDIEVVGTHMLTEAYPNPFNPQTQFTLMVSRDQDVNVSVFDALGRQVALLHEGALDGGMAHQFTLDARGFASGAYLIRVVGENFSDSQRITLLK